MAAMLLEWVFTSTFLILVVLILRAALGKRMSAGLRYALWAVVLVRLLVPVQLFTSPIAGTWVTTEKRTEHTVYTPASSPITQAEQDGVLSLGGQNGPAALGGFPQAPNPPAVPDPPEPPDLDHLPGWVGYLGWAWLAGSAAVLFVLLLSNLRFFWKLRRERIPLEVADRPLRVYVATGLPSPCLFGLIRPAVYVTPEAAANPDMLRHVLAHEYTHFRHGDHLWSLLRCAALAVHWWNPLVWASAVLSQRDAELACDEGALKRLGDGERMGYGSTLLALVTAKPRAGDLFRCATTMAGDKKSLKERVSRIAIAPKRVVWAFVVAVLVTALACVCAFGQAAEPEAQAPAPSDDPAASAEPSAAPSQEPELDPDLDRMLSYFVPDVSEVPEDVLWAVRKIVWKKDYEYVGDVDGSPYWEAGIEFDGFRVQALKGPWTRTAYDMDLEVWQINYEFHTTTPEAAMNLVNGGAYLTEDGWLCPTYPNSTYAVFLVNDAGTRGFLTDALINDCHPDGNSELFWETVGAELVRKNLVDPTGIGDLDLNHNRVPENLLIYQMAGGIGQKVEVWENGEMLWADEGHYSHAGWNAVFLYRDGGQDYLLRYNPYMGQGAASYSYKLFSLAEDGEEVVRQEHYMEFDINFHPLFAAHHSFDPEAIAAFMDEINPLLANSVQLINTDDNLLGTFEKEGRLYDSVSWLSGWEPPFVPDEHKSLLENLRDFQAAMEAEWYAVEPAIATVNENEEGADIWLSYQGKNTRFIADYWEWGFQPAEQVPIQVVDLNHDGRNEIVFPLVWGHGTGAYIEKLYVFDAETLEQYDTSGLNDMILASVQSTGDEDWFYLQGPGMPGPTTLNKHAPRDNPDAVVAEAISLGNVVRYTVDDGVVSCWLGCDTSGVTLGYEGYMQVWLEFTPGGGFQCVYSEYVGDAPFE